eukprot:678167-Pelagomonas_calceolata.AAC.4
MHSHRAERKQSSSIAAAIGSVKEWLRHGCGLDVHRTSFTFMSAGFRLGMHMLASNALRQVSDRWSAERRRTLGRRVDPRESDTFKTHCSRHTLTVDVL